MWSQGASEDDDTLANALIDISERQIADLTAVCEPILAWDGVCGLVQVRDEDIARSSAVKKETKASVGKKK